MAEIEFSNAAEADLVEIDAYSAAQFGEDTAFEYMHGFDEAFARLRDYPQSGRLMPELHSEIRCLTHRRHRIFYCLEGDVVLIVRIVHHAMDARRALEGAAG